MPAYLQHTGRLRFSLTSVTSSVASLPILQRLASIGCLLTLCTSVDYSTFRLNGLSRVLTSPMVGVSIESSLVPFYFNSLALQSHSPRVYSHYVQKKSQFAESRLEQATLDQM